MLERHEERPASRLDPDYMLIFWQTSKLNLGCYFSSDCDFLSTLSYVLIALHNCWQADMITKLTLRYTVDRHFHVIYNFVVIFITISIFSVYND